MLISLLEVFPEWGVKKGGTWRRFRLPDKRLGGHGHFWFDGWSYFTRPSYLGLGFSYPLFLKRGLFVNKKSTFVFKIWGLILIPYGFTLSEDRCSWWPRQWLSLYFEKQRRKNYLPIICRAHHDCPIFWKQRRNNLLVVICRACHGCSYNWKTKKK